MTIYNGWFDASERAMLRSAIRLFNDVILDTALSRGVPVIELRRVCTEAGDYANPIEPNSQGGEKIARWILRLVRQHDFANDPVVLPGAQEPN